MGTPTGTITMADVNAELGKSSSAQTSLNDADVRALAGIPSGTISMNDLRGKSWKAKYISVSSLNDPRVNAFPWSSSGFGTKYTNPATVPTSSCYSTGASSSGNAVAYGTAQGSGSIFRVAAYPWSSSGYGTLFSSPTPSIGSSVYGIEYSPDNSSVAFASVTVSPYTSAWSWSDSSGFGTKFSDPSAPPTGSAYGLSFKSDGSVLAVGTTSTPYLEAYGWSSSGYGTKFSTPSTIPSAAAYRVKFATNSSGVTVIGVPRSNTPYVAIYPWDNGFGTVFSSPAVAVSPQGRSIAFSYAVNAVIIGINNSPRIQAYEWNSSTGFGSKYSNPAELPSGLVGSVSFAQGDNAIVCSIDSLTAPYCPAYAWSTSGFGTKFADPNSFPGGRSTESRFF